MENLSVIILFLFVLFTLLGTGVWVGLALMGVAWIGMELFTTRPVGDVMITTIWSASSRVSMARVTRRERTRRLRDMVAETNPAMAAPINCAMISIPTLRAILVAPSTCLRTRTRSIFRLLIRTAMPVPSSTRCS